MSFFDSVVKRVQGWVKIKGSDGTVIGNVNDSLKVTGSFTVHTAPLSDPMLAAASGVTVGYESVNKFGVSPVLSGTQYEEVWSGTGKYPWMTAASILSVSSTDANDVNLTGTGAWQVELDGLDANYNPLLEVVNLNGLTPVSTVGLFLRIHRIKVIKAATTDTKNIGDILAHDSGTLLVGHVEADHNQSLSAFYTVKAGYTAFITNVYYANENGKEAEAHLEVRRPNEPFQVKHEATGANYYSRKFEPYIKVTEKSDITIRSESKINEHEFMAGFDLILVKNTLLV